MYLIDRKERIKGKKLLIIFSFRKKRKETDRELYICVSRTRIVLLYLESNLVFSQESNLYPANFVLNRVVIIML